MPNTIRQFYDDFSKEYTESIERCVPRYKEMLSMLFTYLPENYAPQTILELGCGTGNLTCLMSRRFPQSRIQAVDISQECITECNRRLPKTNIEYIRSDFRDLLFPEKSFDLIMSSISIHHLDDEDKKELFKGLFLWQNSEGILTFCDQFRGGMNHLYSKHMAMWKASAFNQGATEKEWHMWMDHQSQHDYHATLLEHVDWLKAAGYSIVDCTWRYLLWATIYAQKA